MHDELHWELMAVSVSLINMKGGVGKTTIASQLAHFAAGDGLRVLAIDLDPQSNLSHAIMGARAYVNHIRGRRPTVAQIFDDYIPAGTDGAPRRLDINELILQNAVSDSGGRVDLVPSRLELSRTLKNPTGTTAIREVRDLARAKKWHVFDYQIPYSRSYATASRGALSLSRTPYTWYDRIEGFSGLKDEMLAAVGFRGCDK